MAILKELKEFITEQNPDADLSNVDTIAKGIDALSQIPTGGGGSSLQFVKDSKGSGYTGAVIEGMVGDDIPAERRNVATGNFSHAEGGDFKTTGSTTTYFKTEAYGVGSHAEGVKTIAEGYASHAEGYYPKATGDYTHAEGEYTEATKEAAHAEGYKSKATGEVSHAEGDETLASGNACHSEGSLTEATGDYTHAEGFGSVASGESSHAEGYYTVANHKCQHVFGEYNTPDSSAASAMARGTYVEIVGNGTKSNALSNCRTLDWDGNEKLLGSITLGMGTADEVTLTAAQLKRLLALLT